ncbi:MAG: ACT domain-containing protein [Candidatus Micrarchaeota archaeon]|nr:ACT domain-containing protein [Candidatus Micrarchaeota archaeon]
MKQMTVIVQDKVGLLADISYILGKAKINIDSVSVVSSGGTAILTFLLSDEKKAAQLLRQNGYKVLESEIFIVKLKDRPGELSELSSKLANAKINILSLYIVAKEAGYTYIAIKVDKTKKAKQLLKPYMELE